MISNFDRIYYRGAIDFCNYHCRYCPFSKRRFSENTLTKDQELLSSFISHVKLSTNKKQDIFLLPYGENLHFTHTMKGLATLSSFAHVEHVAIQTNLSVSIDTLVNVFKKEGGLLSKLVLWCSFHPSQTTITDFVLQCDKLIRYGISFSVGSVAVPNNYGLLKKLRERLPSSVYFWLNAQDGKKEPYTRQEELDFVWLDPFFTLELNKPLADITECISGSRSIFWNSDGCLSPCVVSRTRCGKIGSVHKTDPTCRSKVCSCFLAYSQKESGTLTDFFGENKHLRIPLSTNKKLLFLDIDGTLVDENGNYSEGISDLLQLLQKNHLLFLNTALPRTHACKKIKALLPFFTGGSFNNGGFIYFFQKNYRHVWELSTDALSYFPRQSYPVYEDKKLCKIISKNGVNAPFLLENIRNSKEADICYSTHTYGGKEQACLFIARIYQKDTESLLHIGDSENDVLSSVPYHLVKQPHDLVSYLSEYIGKYNETICNESDSVQRS